MRKTPSVLSSPNNRCTGARRKRVSTEYHHFKSPGNLNNCLLAPEIIPITWRPVTRKLAEFQEIKLCYFIGGPSTILLKETQVEFNCPKECLTFLESPWGEDSKKCDDESFHRASLEKFFSNGVIFTHPRIFRRFLADISETVPLRQKLKKVIFKTIIPSNFPSEHWP